MHWMLLVAGTLTAEPTLIARFETEDQCKEASTELVQLVGKLQNTNAELNSAEGPWIRCKAPLIATELP